MGVKHSYDVYDGDMLVFHGGAKDIAIRFNLKSESMTPYVQGYKMRGKYSIIVNDDPGDMDLDLYDVMDGDKVVYTGTNSQIIEIYNLKPSFRGSVYSKHNYKVHRKYHVRLHGETEEVVDKDQFYDKCLWHFKYMGNSNFYCPAKKKDKLVAKLEENGIKVDVRITSDRKGYVLWEV